MARPRCFLDLSVGEQPAGRLVVELFADQTPRTCENFRQLCTGEHSGLSYAQSPFHRVIDEFMIQGGDIDNGDGTGRTSIYGTEFADENLHWRDMEAKGLVCSANSGPDTNGSQFFITLEPCEHLNGKHTVFGQLVAGHDVLDRISQLKVDKQDRPLEPVLISRCGELEKRKKKQDQHGKPRAVEGSHDRGRRRSNASDVEMEDSPEPQPKRTHRHRRQSDNQVDEGLRGRPRQRSGSRSDSRALSSPSEEEDSLSNSPARKHKRKRSPSPSRHKGEGAYERRRRSLPNQYRDDRAGRLRDDEQRYKPSPRRDDRRPSDRRDDRHGGDRYRPSRDRGRNDGDGRLGDSGARLGGGGGYDDYDPPVKFKGRGAMKYREEGRL